METIFRHMRDVTDTVRGILRRDEQCRSDDRRLWQMVCRKYGVDTSRATLDDWASGKLEVPAYESVRRARQKIQAGDPSLRADDDVIAGRVLAEQRCRMYARRKWNG